MGTDTTLRDIEALAASGSAGADAIAAALALSLETAGATSGVRAVETLGPDVMIEFLDGQHWCMECVAPDAFRFYPGVVGEGAITWLNVWVVPDLSRDEAMTRLREVADEAMRKSGPN